MSKPAITTEKWLEIGGNNNFDVAEKLLAAFDGQSVLACGEARWGRDFGKHGFMHSTDHRSALLKIHGQEPTWLAVYDSWSAGDGIPTQAFLMEPDDNSLTYCLIRFYNSMARGLREWSSILSTDKLSNGKPVMGECASRVRKEEPPPRFTLSERSLETVKLLPMNGLKIGPGRAVRLQKLREEIEAQLEPPPARVTLTPRTRETVGMLPMTGQVIGPGRAARLQKLREELEAQLKP